MADDSVNDILMKLKSSTSMFLRRDRYLLEVDANERSITHRLAVYIEKQFPKWDVDCEYNRMEGDPKRLSGLLDQVGTPKPDDTNGTTVFPDIIVHHRGKSENLLVVELKKAENPTEAFDWRKLTKYKEILNYEHGVFLKVRTGKGNPGFEEPQFQA